MRLGAGTCRAGLALAIAAAAPAAGSAADRSVALVLQGWGPYYTVQLPMALHARTGSPDLQGLRPINGHGAALPFAWLPAATADRVEHATELPLFLRPGQRGKAPVPPGWVLDARGVPGRLHHIELTPADTQRGVFVLSVQHSTDLQHWETVLPAVQVLVLAHQGRRLQQTGVELPALAPGYLKLDAVPGSALPTLVAARASSHSTRERPPVLQWSAPIEPASCTAQACDYRLPAPLPLARLQVRANQPDSLAELQVLGRDTVAPAATPPPSPHGLRERLRAVRDKTRPGSVSPAQGWSHIASTSVYWLRLADGEARSPALAVPAGPVFRELRLHSEGPISPPGHRPPTLRVAVETRSLVFLASGPPPYRLAWSDATVAAAAPLSLQQLLPAGPVDAPLPADTASVQLDEAAAPAVPAAMPPSAPPAAAGSGRPWLWAVLLAGLAMMAAMAASLLRKRPGAAAGPDDRPRG
ncbi:DUF3999 domain-containing protein [Aquabacterium sp. A7-Y]|uniref:DUF3999 family protein n=1 Tax=Aquabacterium sp. A7-Y TaxID=1349605 RepID=UPI00223E0BA3|nr:DUF3999 family protein [Aquabacterium sp. A7-Y]MCW7536560.1 DUF3999 domain-containing protein [Aquabacterium sp. A7-Y]